MSNVELLLFVIVINSAMTSAAYYENNAYLHYLHPPQCGHEACKHHQHVNHLTPRAFHRAWSHHAPHWQRSISPESNNQNKQELKQELVQTSLPSRQNETLPLPYVQASPIPHSEFLTIPHLSTTAAVQIKSSTILHTEDSKFVPDIKQNKNQRKKSSSHFNIERSKASYIRRLKNIKSKISRNENKNATKSNVERSLVEQLHTPTTPRKVIPSFSYVHRSKMFPVKSSAIKPGKSSPMKNVERPSPHVENLTTLNPFVQSSKLLPVKSSAINEHVEHVTTSSPNVQSSKILPVQRSANNEVERPSPRIEHFTVSHAEHSEDQHIARIDSDKSIIHPLHPYVTIQQKIFINARPQFISSSSSSESFSRKHRRFSSFLPSYFFSSSSYSSESESYFLNRFHLKLYSHESFASSHS